MIHLTTKSYTSSRIIDRQTDRQTDSPNNHLAERIVFLNVA